MDNFSKEKRLGYSDSGKRLIGRPRGSGKLQKMRLSNNHDYLEGIMGVLPIKVYNSHIEIFIKRDLVNFMRIDGRRVFLHLKDASIVEV